MRRFVTVLLLSLLLHLGMSVSAEQQPQNINVPQLSRDGDTLFYWETRGSYTFYTAPRDWEKGKITWQMLRDGRTGTDSVWSGGETINLPRGQVECIYVRAYRYQETKKILWEFRWGIPKEGPATHYC